MNELNDLRNLINEVDKKIINLLTERKKLSIEAAKTKQIKNESIRDMQRESELLANLIDIGSNTGLDKVFLKNLFSEIINNSVKLQEDYIRKSK